ncbi:MAG: DUF2116 family Zn-ribbon domain-containing protein [Promethearchaeota archaeon]
MVSSIKKKHVIKKDKVFPHKHCIICDKIIPEFSDGYCSDACRNYKKINKKNRNKKAAKLILSYGIIFALIIIMIIIFL